MLIAVFADIHGNLEAFQRVLEDIKNHSVERIFSLGDNVGYGPDPEPVMELIRKHGIESVLGNHEKALIEDAFVVWFNPLAQQAIHYTKAHLSSQSICEFGDLPKSRVFMNMRFVHGAPPASPVLYLFQLTEEKLAKRMRDMDEDVCFAGHTHDLGLYVYDGCSVMRLDFPEGDTSLDPGRKYIVNVGSVGQPRDGNTKAKYVLFDTEKRMLSLKTVIYDNKTTAKKIINAGIPEQYAHKLLG